MRSHLTLLLALLLLLPAAASAGAEITLVAGYRVGDASFQIEARDPLIVCVTTPCVLADARTEDGELEPTLMVGVPISDHWMVEALYNQQEGDLELRSAVGPLAQRETYDSATLQVGLLRHWGAGTFRPFVSGAVGATSFETAARVYDPPLFPGIIAAPVDTDVLSASAAGGVKAHLADHVALRLEGRVYWHDLPESLGGALTQTEVGVGITYSF